MTPQTAQRFLVILAAVLCLGGEYLCLGAAQAYAEGERILFAGHNGASWDIWSVRPDGKALRRLTTWPGDERRPALRQGRLLYINGERRLELMDLTSGQRRSLLATEPGYHDQPVWLADGSFLYVQYLVLPQDKSSIHLCRVTADGKNWEPPRLLHAPEHNRLFPAPAPAGQRFAFTEAIRSSAGLYEEIGIARLENEEAELLTDFKADSLRPAWSPDGRRLLFCSNRDGNYDIWLLDLASRAYRRLTDHPAYDCDPTWSPDGGRFAFISSRQGGRRLWIKPIDGGPARLVADMPAMDPVWTTEPEQEARRP